MSLEEARRLLEERNRLKDAIHQEGNQRRSMDSLGTDQAAYMSGHSPQDGSPAIRVPGGKPLPAKPVTNGSVPKGGLVDAKLSPTGSQFDQMPHYRGNLVKAEPTKAPTRYGLKLYVEYLSLGGGSISDYPVELWRGLRGDPDGELLETYTVTEIEGLETDLLLTSGDAFHLRFSQDGQVWQGDLGSYKTSTPSPKGVPLWMYSPNCEGWIDSGGQVVFSDPQEAQEDTAEAGTDQDTPECFLSAYKPHRLLFKQNISQETKCFSLASQLKQIPTFIRHYKGSELLPQRAISLETGIPESDTKLGSFTYGGDGTFRIKQDNNATRFRKDCQSPPPYNPPKPDDPEEGGIDLWVGFVSYTRKYSSQGMNFITVDGAATQLTYAYNRGSGGSNVTFVSAEPCYDPSSGQFPYRWKVTGKSDATSKFYLLPGECPYNGSYDSETLSNPQTFVIWIDASTRACNYDPIVPNYDPSNSCQGSDYGGFNSFTLGDKEYSVYSIFASPYMFSGSKEAVEAYYEIIKIVQQEVMDQSNYRYNMAEAGAVTVCVDANVDAVGSYDVQTDFKMIKYYLKNGDDPPPPPPPPPDPPWDGVYLPPPQVNQWYLDG